MTDIGYQNIIDSLDRLIIEVPEGMTADQVTYWLKGYMASKYDAVKVIEVLREGNRQR